MSSVNVPPSQTSAVYTNNGFYLVIHAELDEPLDLAALAPPKDVTRAIIVAEDVVIAGGVLDAWRGLSMTVLCNTLTVTPVSGELYATINVSGVNGLPDVQGVQSRPGGNGGDLYVYVEELSNETLNGLKLLADGGNGSRFPGSNETHGPGGNGGNGGTVTLHYRNPARPIQTLISTLAAKKWVDQLPDLDTMVALSGVCTRLGYTLDAQIITTVQDTFKAYSDFLVLLTQLSLVMDAALGNDLDKQPLVPLTGAAQKAVQQAVKDIATLKLTTLPPKQPAAAADLLKETVTVLNNFIIGSATEAEVVAQMAHVQPFIVTANDRIEDTDLGKSVMALDLEVQTSVTMTLASQINASMVRAASGQGGPGGFGNPNGVPGQAGTIIIQEIYADGNPLNLSATKILAFPDQCQMLLKTANGLFFRGDSESIIRAGSLYTLLLDRLSFVPTLYPASGTKPASTPPPLMQAFAAIDGTLTGSTADTFVNVYSAARTSLNLLLSGRDMFGHLPDWSPRLSAASYANQATISLGYLDTINDHFNTYKTAFQSEATMASLRDAAKQSASNQISAANAQITLLIGEGGFLESNAEQIENLTPVMASKRSSLLVQLSTIKHDIEDHFDFDTGSILSAIASIAMAPSAGFAGATAVNQLYQSMTEITDDQGNKVNKTYIISKISDYSGTIQSLTENYTRQSDGEISPEDPGGAKVLATSQDIEQLLNEFSNAIPKDDKDAVTSSLQDYIDTINKRNSFVLSYNACVQQYVASCTNLNFYTSVLADSATSLASIPPDLPAIYYWLSKQLDDALLDTMRYMNYQARAIRFWGLSSVATFDAQALVPYDQLLITQSNLSGQFNTVIESYGGHVWSQWPANFETGTQSSVFHHINQNDHPVDIALFKKGTLDANQKRIYGLTMKFDAANPPPGLTGLANARLYQVRAWLLGAKFPAGAEHTTIHVNLTHAGTESFMDTDGKQHDFEHDAIKITFLYDTKGVTKWSDCTTAKAGSSENLEQTFSGQSGLVPDATTYAAVGPFTTWTLEVKESDCPDVDVSGVTDIYLEFWGRSQAT